MAGHMGDKFRTIQNLEIIKSDLENNLNIYKRINSRFKKFISFNTKKSKKINKKTTL